MPSNAAVSCRQKSNADGTGYYRFALDKAGWQGLVEDAAQLAAAEALVLADSLDAAFRAGRVPAETYVSGMAALVNHDAWDVADAAATNLESITSIVDSEQLLTVEPALQKERHHQW